MPSVKKISKHCSMKIPNALQIHNLKNLLKKSMFCLNSFYQDNTITKLNDKRTTNCVNLNKHNYLIERLVVNQTNIISIGYLTFIELHASKQ